MSVWEHNKRLIDAIINEQVAGHVDPACLAMLFKRGREENTECHEAIGRLNTRIISYWDKTQKVKRVHEGIKVGIWCIKSRRVMLAVQQPEEIIDYYEAELEKIYNKLEVLDNEL